MQTPPAPGEPLRFCHLLLQKDLLGGWTLVREAGRQGASGRVTRRHFADREAAEQALMQARDRQSANGFRTVFAEGVTTP